MTKANLNFVYQNLGERPRVRYYYHNSDQYPAGLRDLFNVNELLNNLTPRGFKKWIKKNYKGEAREIDHCCIYYNELNFLTNYSYIFEPTKGYIDEKGKRHYLANIRVYEWDELIFCGTTRQFKKWLKKQKAIWY